MTIEGYLTPPKGKKNPYWSVEIPLLEIYTQGKTEKAAYAMAADAVEALVNKEGFRVIVTPRKKHTFALRSEDTPTFLAFILSRLRSTHQLTAREVAERLESSSPNRYARYEQGKTMPKLDTLQDLLKAINSDLELVLKIA